MNLENPIGNGFERENLFQLRRCKNAQGDPANPSKHEGKYSSIADRIPRWDK